MNLVCCERMFPMNWRIFWELVYESNSNWMLHLSLAVTQCLNMTAKLIVRMWMTFENHDNEDSASLVDFYFLFSYRTAIHMKWIPSVKLDFLLNGLHHLYLKTAGDFQAIVYEDCTIKNRFQASLDSSQTVLL